MLHLSPAVKYFLYSEAADMRKGFDNLSGIVSSQMHGKVLDGSVFIFLNRTRTHIKLPSLCKALHNLGRKNYLFAGSHDAAQRSAMIYSLFATCTAQGINP